MELRKVDPHKRFSLKNVYSYTTATVWLIDSRYYKCPHCNKKRIVRHMEVSPFAKKKTPLDFDPETLKVFDDMGTKISLPFEETKILDKYDFYCKGCGRPVRLLYEELERGMGASLRAAVYRIIEQI
jgi:hypothetical protein